MIWHILFLSSLTLISGIIPQENLKNFEKSKEEELTLQLGTSLYDESRVDESLLIFQDFIDLYPNSGRRSQALEKIAVIYEEKQQFISAQKVYHQLFRELGFSSKGLKYYLEEARLLEIMGDIEGAQRIYATIERVSPDSDLLLKAKRRAQLNRLFESPLPNDLPRDTNQSKNSSNDATKK